MKIVRGIRKSGHKSAWHLLHSYRVTNRYETTVWITPCGQTFYAAEVKDYGRVSGIGCSLCHHLQSNIENSTDITDLMI